MPPQHRNVAGIFRFVRNLLPEMKTNDLIERVQHISLPRHHLDKPDDQPKCKGLALVTMSKSEDFDYLLQSWPWQRPKSASGTSSGKDLPDAVRFGFRTTTKSHWDKMNQEYLSYRQKLLDQIAQEERTVDDAEPSASVVPPPAVVEETAAEDGPSDAPGLELSAPYPPGCLVFVRHVHMETNKTTLRKLLSQAFTNEEPGSSDDGIGYVDFNKGMNTVSLQTFAFSSRLFIAHAFSVTYDWQLRAIPNSSSSSSPITRAFRPKASTARGHAGQTRSRRPFSSSPSLESARRYIGRRFPKKSVDRPWRRRSLVAD